MRSAINTIGKRWSVRTKIALGVGSVALLIWALLAFFSYRVTSNLTQTSSQQIFNAAAKSIKADLLNVYDPVKRTVSILANSQVANASSGSSSAEQRLEYVPMLVDILNQIPISTAIQSGNDQGDYFIVRKLLDQQLRQQFNMPEKAAFSADFIKGGTGAYQRWFYDNNLNLIEHRQLSASKYDPRSRPWYQLAMTSDGAVFSDPYVFYFMKVVGVTPAIAMADRKSVIAIDIMLKSISESLSAIQITPSTIAVLAHNNNIVAWSGSEPVLIQGEDGKLRQRTLAELDHPVIQSIAEKNDPEGWLVYRTTINLTDNFNPEFIIAVPEKEYLTGLKKTRNWILIGSFLLLAILIPMTWLFSHRITKPLHALHVAIKKTGDGNFDVWLPEIKSFDEVGELNLAFRKMRFSLKQYINNLAEATAAKERLKSELDIARRIQMGMVPGHGELDIHINHYKIFARLFPAKAVGGDLYLFFELPDDKLFIAVGDVSDKGIPAALFMSRMVSLTKLLVPKMASLTSLVSELNDVLAEENDANMFITFFCAVVDPTLENLHYVCAGHNPPVVVGDSVVNILEFEAGLPLGIMPGFSYQQFTRPFTKSEKLVIYSDGITEALDENEQDFTEKRLLELLSHFEASASAEEIGQSIFENVRHFTGNAPQSDDITLLVMESE